jgi:hypothetical protein
LFGVVFCLPFWIGEAVYRFRYKPIDDFAEKLANIIKDNGAVEVAGARDTSLAKVYQEQHSYVSVIIGVASFYFLILLKKRGHKVARHFARSFYGLGEEFVNSRFGIYQLAEEVLRGIEPKTKIDMVQLYRKVGDKWCKQYKTLPGVGLLTRFEFDAFFLLSKDHLDASLVRWAKDDIEFMETDQVFVSQEKVHLVDFVSGNDLWWRYKNIAFEVSKLLEYIHVVRANYDVGGKTE